MLACALASASARAEFIPALSVGHSAIVFSDSRVGTMEEKVLTVKGDLTLKGKKSRFEVGGGAYQTVKILSSSTEMKPRFFGANVRAGYALVAEKDFRVILSVGWAMTRMTHADIGYDGMPALLTRIAIRKELSRKLGVGAYLKYAPTLINAKPSFFESLEAAVGGDISLAFGGTRMKPNKAMFIAVDVARYMLYVSGVRIRADSTSMALGIRF
jgi:hypothetical protein